MNKIENSKCPNCGAPVTTEICPYCHNATGLNTAQAYMEYPVIECKEAHINFWNTIFPMIFAIFFGMFGILFPIPFLLLMPESALFIIPMCSIFVLIGLAAFIITYKSYSKHFKIKKFGKEIEATVYGYMDDNVYINGLPAQIVKLKVDTDEGPKFILYQLGDTKQPYMVNKKIKLKVYKDIFLLQNDNKYYFK